MRTYEQTHPWLSFRLEPRNVPFPIWLLLGEATADCQRLRRAALPSRDGTLTNYVAMLQGVVANASLDGNSMSEDQVDRLLEGSLQLPPSQVFLEREMRNLVKAVQWTEARAKAGDRDTGPWAIQMLNAQVLKEIPSATGASAGAYRTDSNLKAEGAILPKDISPLMDRLNAWGESALFQPEHEEERMAFAIVRAVLTHLYLLWILPFAEGNGRTARLVEFQLLLNGGVPAPAAHRMTVHASVTRSEYARQVAQAATPNGNVIPFIAYMVRGFADGVKALLDEVSEAQNRVMAQEELRIMVDPLATSNGERLQALARSLQEQRGKVPTAKVTQLSPELALTYARLNAKTLHRDLAQLEELGLVERSRGAVQARTLSVRPFAIGS